MPPFLIPLLPYLIPGLFGAGSAIASANNVNKMNRYNDPSAQLQRLNAAGLPFSAFSQGQAGNQSSLPDVSGIKDAGAGMANYFVNQNQKEQHKLLIEQVRAAKAAADTAEINRDVAKSDSLIHLGQNADAMKIGVTDEKGHFTPMYLKDKRLDFDQKQYQNWVNQRSTEAKIIEDRIMRELDSEGKLKQKTTEELDQLILSNTKARGEIDNQEKMAAARNKIIETFQKGGLNLIEAILIVIAQKYGF